MGCGLSKFAHNKVSDATSTVDGTPCERLLSALRQGDTGGALALLEGIDKESVLSSCSIQVQLHKNKAGVYGVQFAPGAGTTITHLFPGTPASESTLAIGDVLTHVDGQDVKGMSFENSMQRIKGTSSVSLNFLRSTGMPLHVAALCNARGGVVSRLLAIGGQELLDMKDSNGKTARELAAAKSHTDVVAEIDRWVEQQAAWEQEGARNASLIAAARDNDATTIQTLLAKGANLYAQDAQGFSALHAAAQAGHTDVADLLLKQGGARLAWLTTKEGKTARDLAVCLLRETFFAKPELTDSMQEVLASHQARVDQASDSSKERARSSMIALLDSQMSKLDTAALRAQTALTASDVLEREYLLMYEQEQAQLREIAAAALEKCRIARDKHAQLEKELCDQHVQLWHEQMSQMRAMHEQQRAMHEQHAAKRREVEEQLQADNEQLKRAISCISDRHAQEQALIRAIQERIKSIQAAYVKSSAIVVFSYYLMLYIYYHVVSYDDMLLQAAYVKSYDPAKHPLTLDEHLVLVKVCILSMDFTPGGSGAKFLSDPDALVVGPFSKAAEGWARLACKDEDELNAKVAEVDPFLKSRVHIQ